MAWRRLVTRKDSIIRFWCIAQLECGKGYAQATGDRSLTKIAFSSHTSYYDGSQHVRVEELTDLAQHLVKSSQENPTLLVRMGEHYEKLGLRWLRFLEELGSTDLKVQSDSALADTIDEFARYYTDYAPILYAPFVVEKRYKEEYPNLLDRIRVALQAKANSFLQEDGMLRALNQIGMVAVCEDEALLRDSLRQVLEYTSRRTMSEEKADAVLEVAAQIENRTCAPIFDTAELPSPDEIRHSDKGIFDSIVNLWKNYGWLKHWGYPPYYQASTLEEIIEEVQVALHKGPSGQLLRKQKEKEQVLQAQKVIRVAVSLNEHEQALLRDINYYDFLRTYRMEILIKAQFLSIPLFQEAERRMSDILDKDEIFLLTPPDTSTYLRARKLSCDLRARRKGWALSATGFPRRTEIWDGDRLADFEDDFFSVIAWNENGRGPHSPTTDFVGGKATNLYKLLEYGYDIPKFFVVTSEAFLKAVVSSAIYPDIQRLLKGLSPHDKLEDVFSKIRALIKKVDFPEKTRHAIENQVQSLGLKEVAVRSSATLEDSAEYSWAGRFRSILPVRSDKLSAAIKDVWASLFSPQALAYALDAKLNLLDAKMAVVVQELLEPDVAGVVNSCLSMSQRDVVEIEAIYGFGEPLVSGEVTPDRYLVDASEEYKIVEKVVSKQARRLSLRGWADLPESLQNRQKIADELVVQLAKLGKEVEQSFDNPQDIEFAVKEGKIIILQTRPQTGLSLEQPITEASKSVPQMGKLVATGLRGKVAQKVRARAQVLKSLEEGSRFEDGNVLVVNAATPSWDPITFRASAIVTNEGGSTCHAIRVANERGFPAVVGTKDATEKIQDGDMVLVDTESDTFKGKVYVIR